MCSPVAERHALLLLGRNRSYESESGLDLFFDGRGLIGSSLARGWSWLGKEEESTGEGKSARLGGLRTSTDARDQRERQKERRGVQGVVRSATGSGESEEVVVEITFGDEGAARSSSRYHSAPAGRASTPSISNQPGLVLRPFQNPCVRTFDVSCRLHRHFESAALERKTVGRGSGPVDRAQVGQGFHLIDRPAGRSSQRRV